MQQKKTAKRKDATMNDVMRARQLLNDARRLLTRGMHKLLLALQAKGGLLQMSKLRFDDERTRFNHRFKTFSNIGIPPPLTYEAVAKVLHPPAAVAVDTSEMLRQAAASFQVAGDRLREIASLPPSFTMTEMCQDEFQEVWGEITTMKTLLRGNKMFKGKQANATHKCSKHVNYQEIKW